MHRTALGVLLLACGCANVATGTAPLPVLDARPEQPHREIRLVEASGAIGARLSTVHEELREQARELGADALVVVKEERKYHPAPEPDVVGGRPDLGDAYPDALAPFSPGAFPYEGNMPRSVAGYYWEVSALAIEYDTRNAAAGAREDLK